MVRVKRKASELEGGDESLIIALDFGTTYSGVAYCFTSDHDPKPTVIVDWPGTQGVTMPKTPTVISYSGHGGGDFKWGMDADEVSDAIRGIKLLLDPTQHRPAYLSAENPQKAANSLPKPVIEIASDFIKSIYEYALSEISAAVPKDYVALCTKSFVLTVPAVWSDAAKHATLEAAKNAGIQPVTLVKEPEAAALYATQTIDFALQPQDAFVVCDAGGGTVDLISYEVESVRPTLRVKELVPGSGGMSGSIGLNLRFANAVQALVGQEQWRQLQGTRAWTTAQRQFDQNIKKSFERNVDFKKWVDFPTAGLRDEPASGLKGDSWKLTEYVSLPTEEVIELTDGARRHLLEIFDPLIKDNVKLIEEQVKKSILKRNGRPINGILLVGGFGSSKYLRQAVQKHFPDIQVLQPRDGWAAIVKGAVLSHLPKQAIVTSTSATRHYGVEASDLYNYQLDFLQEPKLDRQHVYRVNKMIWYIKTGDDLRRDNTIKFPFYSNIDIDYHPQDLIFVNQLYQCEDMIAPRHRSTSTTVKINCTVTCDLSDLSRSHFKMRRDRSRNYYYEVHYDLVITLKSAMMVFSLEVDGETKGSVRAEFD